MGKKHSLGNSRQVMYHVALFHRDLEATGTCSKSFLTSTIIAKAFF